MQKSQKQIIPSYAGFAGYGQYHPDGSLFDKTEPLQKQSLLPPCRPEISAGINTKIKCGFF
jgi:hypothetical protein